MKQVKNVQETGVTRTKHMHRLTPVSGTCIANLPEHHSLCHRTIAAYCAQENGEESLKARKA
ncbi:hypothetical protein BD769DRAFT_1501132, partial [Suillus cothurnatus]